MISILKNWITSIVVVIIFMALVDMILPANSLKKYAKFVLGLIVILIIMKPVFTLFDHSNDVEGEINQYIERIDGINAAKEKTNSNVIDAETLKVFKENLEKKIIDTIWNGCKNKYEIVKMEIIEDPKNQEYLSISSIVLKSLSQSKTINLVTKVSIENTEDKENYFWDKAAGKILEKDFNIKTSDIKFER